MRTMTKVVEVSEKFRVLSSYEESAATMAETNPSMTLFHQTIT